MSAKPPTRVGPAPQGPTIAGGTGCSESWTKREDVTMLVRLSSNRVLNLSDVAEVQFTFDLEPFAAVSLLTGGSLGACGAEAEAIRAALRARSSQFAEIESGRYFNLDGILSADLATTPEVSVRGRWRR